MWYAKKTQTHTHTNADTCAITTSRIQGHRKINRSIQSIWWILCDSKQKAQNVDWFHWILHFLQIRLHCLVVHFHFILHSFTQIRVWWMLKLRIIGKWYVSLTLIIMNGKFGEVFFFCKLGHAQVHHSCCCCALETTTKR